MIEIRPLKTIDLPTLREIITGHETQEKYCVQHHETDNEISFQLKLVALPEKQFKGWQPDQEDFELYKKAIQKDTCLAAYESDKMVGIAIAEPHEWNETLWLWEFHVRPDYHRQGIGWLLMEEVIQLAQTLKLRVITCETQTTNVAAIRFYRAMGFTMDSIDLSYYSNEDQKNDNIAVFLKRKIQINNESPAR